MSGPAGRPSWHHPGNRGRRKETPVITSRGLALIALGLSISLDELAIGFTIGLAHLAVTTIVAAIALQAPLSGSTRRGHRRHNRRTLARAGGTVAGIVLILLGAYLIGEQLAQ